MSLKACGRTLTEQLVLPLNYRRGKGEEHGRVTGSMHKCAKNLFIGGIYIFPGDRKVCGVGWDPYFFLPLLYKHSILSYIPISFIGLQ